MRTTASHCVLWTLLLASLIIASGCGYMLHPERRTEPLSKTHDTTIVVYDCLWLLAFVVPGVVAIVVDAVNDTWLYTEKELSAHQASGKVAK